MITEPSWLVKARAHLASFEKMLMEEDGLYHLSEGLVLLEEAEKRGIDPAFKEVAHNLGNTYATKLCSEIDGLLHDQKIATQPELEHVFKLLSELETSIFENREKIGKLRGDTIKALFDQVYRGYSRDEKLRVLKELSKGIDT